MPNKQRLGVQAEIAPPLAEQPWFLALQGVPVAAFISAFVWRKRTDSLAHNPRLRRQRQVAQIVREGVNRLRQLAAQNNSDEFFATLVHLVQEQIGERLDLPASAITEAVIDERLRPMGVAEPLLSSLQESLSNLQSRPLCAHQIRPGTRGFHPAARKRPAGTAGDKGMSPGKYSATFRLANWLSLTLLLAFPLLCRGAVSAIGFDAANRLYDEGKFADAAAAYEKLGQSGQISPALCFNLGNAFFKSGQIGRAIAAYRQAERLTPRDPDVRANLQFARNQVQGPALLPSRAQRWLTRLTLNEWTVTTTVALWLCLGLLAALQWRPALKPVLRNCLGALILATAISGICCASAFSQSQPGRTALVVVRDASAHNGPLDESPDNFTLHDGAELRVLDQKDDWLQVTSDPSRVGWVRRSQVLVEP